jgi:ATP-dependent exoDNAse (exonuclease V) beta subunit
VRTLAARGRSALAARVRGAWLALGGPATVEEAIDLEAAERYFALLAEHDEGDDVADWAAFVEALAQLHAEAAAADDAAVQAMTLHRAKGLEFDTVIMPGLGRAPHRGNAEILRWRRRPTGLLVAPMKARGGTDDPVYAYLGRLADGEEAAELGRLLYVGCTRAKRRLHLTAALTARAKDGASLTWKSPPAGSALATFWDAVGHTVAAPLAANQEAPPAAQRRLVRLPLAWAPSLPGPGVPVVAATVPIDDMVPFEWARETAKRSGTVAHRLFAQIAREGLSEWSAERVTNLSGRIRTELAGEGVDEAELDAASANVAAMITRLLADERGRWLFDHGHADARSEWALAGAEGDAIAHVVLDRSFVTDGVRWIVDFKTGAHEGGDVAAFLDAEVDRYRSQLDGYARFVRALDARPIRLAIYFPLLAGWREWSYDG